MIKLVPIDAVRASDYNPRRNDEKRLALKIGRASCRERV